MSAGNFVTVRYAATYNGGTPIHPIRVNASTLEAAVGGVTNASPTGAVNNPIKARVQGGRRSFGLLARRVSLRSPATNPPAGYLANSITTIPALTVAFFNACDPTANNGQGAEVSYLGATFRAVGRSSERVDGTDVVPDLS